MKNMKTNIDFTALAADLDQLKAATLAKVGQQDADHIRRVIRWQRLLEISGRVLLMLGFIQPVLWLFGVLALTLSKILDNMEIGHNVMHGQYDWMNDPNINSKNFEWDIACDGQSWKRVHNYEHHTYTNIVGKDRDFGYGLLRLSDDFKWRVNNLWQFFTYIYLSLLFQWGIAYHELAAERVFLGKKKACRDYKVSPKQLKQRFFSKGGKAILKDYVIFPLLAGPLFLWVLSGNLLANLLRNVWTSTVIFCGHFTGDVETFNPKDCENETQGQWYYRQALGSANIEGGRLFHVLTGHLSCQVEHHLFPDMPSSRYQEVAPQVRAIFARHGLPYNSGRFSHQYGSVAKRILRYSLP
jgi:fatty acid desaturase